MKKTLLILPLALSLMLAGCEENREAEGSTSGEPSTTDVSGSTSKGSSSSSSSEDKKDEGKVTSVSLDKSTLTLDVYDPEKASGTLKATVEVTGTASKDVKWESSQPGVASVSNGVVTALAKGYTTIKAISVADSSKSASCTVTVNDSNPALLHTAKVKFGESGNDISLTAMKEKPEGAGGQFQYKGTANVKAGDTITFKFDGAPVEAGDGSKEEEPHANNTFGTYPNYVVHNDKNGAEIYFKVYETGYSFWITGYDSSKPDPEPPAPVHTATLTLGEGSPVDLSLMSGETPKDVAYQFEGEVSVTEGQSIAFTVDGNPVYPGADETCNAKGTHPDYVINNDAENVKVYLKIYDDEGASFWIGGYEEEAFAWHLKGTMTEWAATDDYKMDYDEDTEHYAADAEVQYTWTGALAAGDQFKFANNLEEPIWLGYDSIENQDPIFSRYTKDGDASDNNIIVNATGAYTFYLKKYYDDKVAEHGGKGYEIWVSYPENAKYLTASYDGSVVVGNKIDDNKVTVSFHDGSKPTADVKLTSVYDKDIVYSEAGDYPVEVTYVYEEVTYKTSFNVHVRDEIANMQLHIYVNDCSEWYNTDTPDFFVWYWGGESESRLVAVTSHSVFDVGKGQVEFIVSLPEDATGCKLYRCIPGQYSEGTTCPDDKDKDTKFWNNTGDMDINENEGFHYADGLFS